MPQRSQELNFYALLCGACGCHALGLNSALPVAESFMRNIPDPVQLTRELLKFNTINPPGA